MRKLERKNKGMSITIFEESKYSGSQNFRGNEIFGLFRSRLKDICNPLLKKPVSEEGKLEMKIVSLPPLFGSKRQRMKNFESFGNENFDVNWIGLENY